MVEVVILLCLSSNWTQEKSSQTSNISETLLATKQVTESTAAAQEGSRCVITLIDMQTLFHCPVSFMVRVKRNTKGIALIMQISDPIKNFPSYTEPQH